MGTGRLFGAHRDGRRRRPAIHPDERHDRRWARRRRAVSTIAAGALKQTVASRPKIRRLETFTVLVHRSTGALSRYLTVSLRQRERAQQSEMYSSLAGYFLRQTLQRPSSLPMLASHR